MKNIYIKNQNVMRKFFISLFFVVLTANLIAQHIETFDTEASTTANGWTGVGNRTSPNNYGWADTDIVLGTGTSGAVGGIIARSAAYSYFADTNIGIFDRTKTLHLSGSFRLENDNFDGSFFLGYFDHNNLPAPGAQINNFLGIQIDEPGGNPDLFRSWARIYGGGIWGGSDQINLSQNTVLTFDLLWTGSANGSGTLTGTLAGQPVNVTMDAGTGTFTAFGLLVRGISNTNLKTRNCYFDNLAYTKESSQKYTVIYNANGGEGTITAATKTHDVNLILSDGSGFSRTGYSFSGWNTSADGNGTNYAAGQTYSENADLTLYAIWKLSTTLEVTETFDTEASTTANGWTGIGNRISPNNYGWANTDLVLGTGTSGALGGIIARSAAYSYYADTNIGTFDRTKTLRLAGSFRLENDDFDGNFFLGYFDHNNLPAPGAPINNFLGIQIDEPGGNPDLFRSWARVYGNDVMGSDQINLSQNATLAFDLLWTGSPNGSGTLTGTLAGQPVNFIVGAGTGTFTAFGLLVRGISNTNLKTGNSYFDNLTYMKESSGNYNVIYDANGGEGTIATAIKTHNANLILSDGSGFSRAGYIFSGWNTAADGSGTNYAAGQTYTNNADITLFAVWTIDLTSVLSQGALDEISIYQNATADRLYFENLPQDSRIFLFDINGRSLLVRNASEVNDGLSLQPYANGFYFIKVVLWQKFVKTLKVLKK